MPKFSIIIPLGVCGQLGARAFPVRFENLLFSIDNFYSKIQDVEIIVVSQNIDEKYRSVLERSVNLICLNYPIFNKNWCLNVGVNRATTNTVLLSESEMWSPSLYLNDAVAWFNTNRCLWSFAWSSLVTTSKQDRDSIILEKEVKNESSRVVNKPAPGMFEGGIVIFDKKFFFSIGGANEFMQELGGVDNELIVRARYSSGTYYKYNKGIYHLWHPRSKLPRSNTRIKNLELYKYCIKNTKVTINTLNKCNTNEEFPWCAKTTFFQVRTNKRIKK